MTLERGAVKLEGDAEKMLLLHKFCPKCSFLFQPKPVSNIDYCSQFDRITLSVSTGGRDASHFVLTRSICTDIAFMGR